MNSFHLDKEAAEALLDDCPLCQELQRNLKAGTVEVFSIPVDIDPDDDWEDVVN